MLNLNSILVSSQNPKKSTEFYAKVLQTKPVWTEREFSVFQAKSGHLIIGPHDKVQGKSQNPERVIFNFETEDVVGEFRRIVGLGAKAVHEPYHPQEAKEMWLTTLEDPDGNYFQLASPMKG